MANPAAVVDPQMPAAMLGGIDVLANRRRRRRRRRRVQRPQLIANAAVFLVSTAGSIVIYYGGGGGEEPAAAYALLAFLLALLGIWLVLLALVADRFPAVAALGEAVAMALMRGYFGARRP